MEVRQYALGKKWWSTPGWVRQKSLPPTNCGETGHKKSHGGVDEAETRLWVDKWLGTRANKGRLLFQKSGFGGTRRHSGSEKKMQSQMMMIKMRSFSLLHKLRGTIKVKERRGGQSHWWRTQLKAQSRTVGDSHLPTTRGEKWMGGRKRYIWRCRDCSIQAHGPVGFSVRVGEPRYPTERKKMTWQEKEMTLAETGWPAESTLHTGIRIGGDLKHVTLEFSHNVLFP